MATTSRGKSASAKKTTSRRSTASSGQERKSTTRNASASKSTGTKKGTSTSNARKSTTRTTSARKRKDKEKIMEAVVLKEVVVLLILALTIIMELSVFGVGSAAFGKFLFGVFGVTAYIFPIYLFFGAAFYLSNNDNPKAVIKLLTSVLIYCCVCSLLQMNALTFNKEMSVGDYYNDCKEFMRGGGVIGGICCKMICPVITTTGNYVLCIILMIAGLVVITERSFFGSIKNGGARVYNVAKDDFDKIKEANRIKHEEQEEQRRVDRKARGVEMPELALMDEVALELPERMKNQKKASAITEIPFEPQFASSEVPDIQENKPFVPVKPVKAEEKVQADDIPVYSTERYEEQIKSEEQLQEQNRAEVVKEALAEENKAAKIKSSEIEAVTDEDTNTEEIKKYVFPPLDLLKSGGVGTAKDKVNKEINDTAMKLQQTLRNFGVGVTITDVSYGPSVTRYELQPEQGVKVSKIVGLSDDIKLNLAAADIRIEAPIPGKAAIGIEVPNKENNMVMLRDLLSSAEFSQHKSNIAFAVGKDIGGQTVVTDIAKMPHLLIAGATGSGKSVCINTLIMSILYKAHPNDVKLIMVDPKVVELSVYNGIPHLLIPVVTDPKKAAGALNWAVAEMTDRYKKFAELNVRDLKGYNEKIETIEDIEDENKPKKLPQIVIIVDELADLMMVAPGEVEDAICRLAQMARAAGLHLIIATQRPSVNVITGLIKANVPSRIAFSVSSGVDSRTIIDMNGAEKLLGKGDMLFYPTGYPKPVRVQGAFVSDKEVASVVKFLAEQETKPQYNEEVNKKIADGSFSDGAHAINGGGGSDTDNYFAEAGRFIIEKEKASIGLLQRVFKIGFNRAARIMDQLFEAGVVGPEEGTKPRKILMTMEEFEQYLQGGQ